MIEQSMLLYSSDWHGIRTFRMMPVKEECPFNEVIYDPETKVLAVISKEFKEKPHMFAKLNNAGKPMRGSGDSALEERIFMDTYFEYYIDNINDIKNFVNRFAINSEHDAVKVLDEVTE
jgi:hypothetical protein